MKGGDRNVDLLGERGVIIVPFLGMGEFGGGLGRDGSKLQPCLSRRCLEEQMAGEGRGCLAGRRGAGAGG